MVIVIVIGHADKKLERGRTPGAGREVRTESFIGAGSAGSAGRATRNRQLFWPGGRFETRVVGWPDGDGHVSLRAKKVWDSH